MRYILQTLGRLGGYQQVTFTINGFSHKAYLSSEALSEYYGGDCRITLFAPESTVTWLTGSVEEAQRLLRDNLEFTRFIKQKVEEDRLLNKPFQVKSMQSSGFYAQSSQTPSYYLKFENTFDNIVSEQLMLLVQIDDVDELILDISTGYNFQVLALVEAVRVLIAYHKLKRLLQNDYRLKVKIASIPPVSPATKEGEYPIDLSDFDAKAFFEFPIKGRDTPKIGDLITDASDELKRKLSKDFNWGRVTKAIGEARRAFNAIKYNVPLTLFYDEMIGGGEDFAECLKTLSDMLNYVEEHRSIETRGDTVVIKRSKINRQMLVNLMLTLALHRTLTEFRRGLRRGEQTLGGLRHTFIPLYEKIGLQLNARFLERDLSDFEDEGKEAMRSDVKRNFFAHSGLLRECVGVNGGKRVAYKGECMEKVKRWLEEPESR